MILMWLWNAARVLLVETANRAELLHSTSIVVFIFSYDMLIMPLLVIEEE